MEKNIEIIVAVSRNGIIGNEGKIPWRLRTDLRRFRSITTGAPVIMGRKTWESIVVMTGRPLPGRTSIILTKNKGYAAEDGIVAPSLEAALWFAGGAKRIFVVGGEEVFRIALPLSRTIHLTKVEVECVGDACFPDIDPSEWRIEREEFVPRSAIDEFDSRYVLLSRLT